MKWASNTVQNVPSILIIREYDVPAAIGDFDSGRMAEKELDNVRQLSCNRTKHRGGTNILCYMRRRGFHISRRRKFLPWLLAGKNRAPDLNTIISTPSGIIVFSVDAKWVPPVLFF